VNDQFLHAFPFDERIVSYRQDWSASAFSEATVFGPEGDVPTMHPVPDWLNVTLTHDVFVTACGGLVMGGVWYPRREQWFANHGMGPRYEGHVQSVLSINCFSYSTNIGHLFLHDLVAVFPWISQKVRDEHPFLIWCVWRGPVQPDINEAIRFLMPEVRPLEIDMGSYTRSASRA
jgi:hypothetical protein